MNLEKLSRSKRTGRKGRGVRNAIELYTGSEVESISVVEDLSVVDCRAWAIRAVVKGVGRFDCLIVLRDADDTPLSDRPAEDLEQEIQEGRWPSWPPSL